mmetsp:Transcript_27562/g.92158  ORF Transcript_27562/g.92158 Transcript_27562/m.92158 type:complete len:241 (-) Transcript_27562:822-1544(-)
MVPGSQCHSALSAICCAGRKAATVLCWLVTVQAPTGRPARPGPARSQAEAQPAAAEPAGRWPGSRRGAAWRPVTARTQRPHPRLEPITSRCRSTASTPPPHRLGGLWTRLRPHRPPRPQPEPPRHPPPRRLLTTAPTARYRATARGPARYPAPPRTPPLQPSRPPRAHPSQRRPRRTAPGRQRRRAHPAMSDAGRGGSGPRWPGGRPGRGRGRGAGAGASRCARGGAPPPPGSGRGRCTQ